MGFEFFNGDPFISPIDRVEIVCDITALEPS